MTSLSVSTEQLWEANTKLTNGLIDLCVSDLIGQQMFIDILRTDPLVIMIDTLTFSTFRSKPLCSPYMFSFLLSQLQLEIAECAYKTAFYMVHIKYICWAKIKQTLTQGSYISVIPSAYSGKHKQQQSFSIPNIKTNCHLQQGFEQQTNMQVSTTSHSTETAKVLNTTVCHPSWKCNDFYIDSI